MRLRTVLLAVVVVLAVLWVVWTRRLFLPQAVQGPERLGAEVVATGFTEPTDLAMWPGRPDVLVVLGKRGTAWWVDLDDGVQGVWLTLDVPVDSELGLLGVAFDPAFADSGRLWLHHNATVGERVESRLVEARAVDVSDPAAGVTLGRTVLTLAQPYTNHNGGQIRFGPDGMLYMALGDGGAGGDPLAHGQNRATRFGTLLRLDVVADPPAGEAVRIPADNPFVGVEGADPAVWAYGLRNPWRFDILSDGRVITGDVGQNTIEEVSLISAGDNLGWNTMEGDACFSPPEGCDQAGLVPPIYTYDHSHGVSITGGVVYRGQAIPSLEGRYLFGDFVGGWIRSLPVPDRVERVEARHELAAGVLISAFGRDARGEVLFTDYLGGRVLRVVGR